MTEKQGILVMSYGTPRSLDDIEDYYTDIRRGRPPPPDLLEELTERYKAIGHSPLLEITEAQARGIEERTGISTYVGYKHIDPFIPDAVATMAKDGVERAIGLVLAPHYSKMSVGDYTRRAEVGAAEHGWTGDLRVVKSWHLEPGFIALLAARVEEALGRLKTPRDGETVVIFSAHSLPERILQADDPYPDQLRETAEAVAARMGLPKWCIGWQSAGRTEDPWIGPDILEVLGDLKEEGATSVVVCPAGFVADHLEVLYDIDIEAQQIARKQGIELVRTRSPNDDPEFLDVLAGVVKRALSE
ncbi:MAG: protoporphyrin/coproporphyrin ferrochelatase [Actinomycetota bacterium]|jgi:ferrochelatase|nr:protoporphyrin/coproporphyrin ferrochelatase [Actinomycetota bacterium]